MQKPDPLDDHDAEPPVHYGPARTRARRRPFQVWERYMGKQCWWHHANRGEWYLAGRYTTLRGAEQALAALARGHYWKKPEDWEYRLGPHRD